MSLEVGPMKARPCDLCKPLERAPCHFIDGALAMSLLEHLILRITALEPAATQALAYLLRFPPTARIRGTRASTIRWASCGTSPSGLREAFPDESAPGGGREPEAPA